MLVFWGTMKCCLGGPIKFFIEFRTTHLEISKFEWYLALFALKAIIMVLLGYLRVFSTLCLIMQIPQKSLQVQLRFYIENVQILTKTIILGLENFKLLQTIEPNLNKIISQLLLANINPKLCRHKNSLLKIINNIQFM
jgi:hypothetical protein